MKWQHRFAANVAMMGLVYANAYAGRPGEWEITTRASVEALLERNDHVLKMEFHKTAGKYGALGRFIPAGNLAAMRTYLTLPNRHSTQFFTPSARSKAAQQV